MPDDAIPARLWSCIDANTDNVVSLAAEDVEEDVVELGTSIREAGRDQVPWVDGQRPPIEDEMERSDASYERVGDQESFHLGRRARDVVTHLG